MGNFQIITRGMPSRPEEWFQVLNADQSKLPRLTEEDKRSARIRRMTDEQYARHLLLVSTTRKREADEAEALGKTIAGILQELGHGLQLKEIGKRGLEPGWRALIEFRPNGSGKKPPFYLSLPTEDFSDGQNGEVLDVGDVNQIRNFLMSQLGIENPRTVAS